MELLAPAGSPEALVAAVQGGAGASEPSLSGSPVSGACAGELFWQTES